jgi:hypothetical protein
MNRYNQFICDPIRMKEQDIINPVLGNMIIDFPKIEFMHENQSLRSNHIINSYRSILMHSLIKDIPKMQDFGFINIDHEFFEIIKAFIEKPYLSLSEILDEFEVLLPSLEEKLEPNSQYNVENSLEELILCFLDYRIKAHFKITDEFYDFLIENYYYVNYFNFLERYILYYFKNFEENFHGIEGKFDYERDIEEPDIFYPVLTIIFPTDNYRMVLEILKDFLEIQEMTLKERFKSKYLENIMEYYKKTVFIFDSEI